MKPPKWKTLFTGFILLILPLSWLVTTISLKRVCGPFWLGRGDPSYVHLLNSLAVSAGHSPGHFDQPASTVQVLGALVIRISHALAGEGDVVEDVLKKPEFYLNSIHWTFLLFTTAGLVATGGITLWATRSLYLSLIMQLGPFLSIGSSGEHLAHVCPEPLLILFSTAFATTIVVWVERGTEKNVTLFAGLFGVLSGLDIATKFTAVPLFVLPLVLLPRWAKLKYVGFTGLSLLIASLPALPKYKEILKWFYDLLTHTGSHGKGEEGLPMLSEYLQNLWGLLSTETYLISSYTVPVNSFFIILLLSVLGLSIWSLSQRKPLPADQCGNGIVKCLLAVTLVEVLQLFIVAKHPSAHYLIPALALIAVNVILVYKLILLTRGRAARLSYLALLLITLSLGLVIQTQRFQTLRDYLVKFRLQREDLCREVQEIYKEYAVVYYFSASSVPYALWIGNAFGTGELFAEKIQRLYPDAIFCNVSWENAESSACCNFIEGVDLKEIASRKKGVVFQGMDLSEWPDIHFPSGVVLERLYPKKSELGCYSEVLYKAAGF